MRTSRRIAAISSLQINRKKDRQRDGELDGHIDGQIER